MDRAAAIAGSELLILNRIQVVTGWVADQVGKGRPVAVDLAVAGAMGAFVEDALSPEDARPGGRAKGRHQRRGQARASDLGR